GERAGGGLDRRLAPRLAGERGLASGRAGGNAGHAAEGDSRFADDILLYAQREGAADARNVAVEPFGELDDSDQHVGRRAGYAHALDKLALAEILDAVA